MEESLIILNNILEKYISKSYEYKYNPKSYANIKSKITAIRFAIKKVEEAKIKL